MHRGEGGMHVHPVHPPWVRPWLVTIFIFTIKKMGQEYGLEEDFANAAKKYRKPKVLKKRSIYLAAKQYWKNTYYLHTAGTHSQHRITKATSASNILTTENMQVRF
jgi:hypothetical protein